MITRDMGSQDEKKLLAEIQRTEFAILQEVVALFERHGLNYTMYCGTLLGAVRHKGFIPWDDDIDLAMPLADYKKFSQLGSELGKRYSLVHFDNSYSMDLNWIKVFDEQTVFKEKRVSQYPGHYGVSIDIYPFIGAFSTRTGQKLQNLLLKTAYIMRRASSIKYIPEKRRQNAIILELLSVIPFPIRNAIARFCRKMAMLDPDRHPRIGTIDAAPFEGKYDAKDWKEMIQLPFEGAYFSAPARYDKLLRTMYGDYTILPPEHMRCAHITKDMIIDMHRSYREYVEYHTERGRDHD